MIGSIQQCGCCRREFFAERVHRKAEQGPVTQNTTSKFDLCLCKDLSVSMMTACSIYDAESLATARVSRK